MASLSLQIRQWLGHLTPRQRVVSAGSAFLVVLALVAMVRVFSGPDYRTFMTGLEPADAQAIGAELASKKIQYQLASDGKSIQVPVDEMDAARMEVAAEGPVHSGRMGFEIFDKSSWGQTEFDEKVNYQRALEGELERTISTLSGVKSARVHVVMPAPSVFLDRQRAAKASVALRMKHGSLPDDQLLAIGRLVSGAVDDLQAKDVVILNADTNETLGNHSSTTEGHELEAELTRRVLATLGPAVGAENIRASVNIEFDQSSREESQDKYDPAVSAVLSSQKSHEQTGAGLAASGIAGTSANLPASTPGSAPQDTATTGDDNSQVSSSENATFGVNKTTLHTVTPAGRIHRLTAAILVNDLQERKQVKGTWVSVPRKPTTTQLQQLQQLAQSVLGADGQRGDVVTVQNMSFSTEASSDGQSSPLDRLRAGMVAFATPLRYAAMLVLFVLMWALIIRPVQKGLLLHAKNLNPGEVQPSLPLASDANSTQIATAASVALPSSDEPEFAAAKRKLAELVQTEPAAMTRTLQAWLREDTA